MVEYSESSNCNRLEKLLINALLSFAHPRFSVFYLLQTDTLTHVCCIPDNDQNIDRVHKTPVSSCVAYTIMRVSDSTVKHRILCIEL